MSYLHYFNPRFINERMQEYKDKIPDEYQIPKVLLLWDMAWSFLTLGCSVSDYFQYEFYKLNYWGKNTFFTSFRFDKYCTKYNDPYEIDIINSKDKSLEFFRKYVHRDWCGYFCKNTKEDYKLFAEKHQKAIVKPLDSNGGHGIHIVDIDELKKVGGIEYYCKNNKFILEELIIQHEDMNRLYASAVNTIRMVFIHGELVGAVIRMGVGDSVVDNASSGGLFAEVDISTGIVVSCAQNHAGKEYIIHPTTSTVIPGFQVPMWKECIELSRGCSDLIKNIPLLGLDIAIAVDGPTLVEANGRPGPFLLQQPRGKGIKKYI